MTRRVVVLSDARGEITDASDWYHERSPTIGARFRAEVRACLARIQRNPFGYQKVYGDARAALLERFPYAIVFIAEEPDTLVISCIHQRRDPANSHGRLP